MRALLHSWLMLLTLTLWGHAAQAADVHRDLAKILSSGELKVGVALYSPWVLKAKNGVLVGAEIDIARRLAKDMGVKIDWVTKPWDQLIPALETGEVDIIVAGMSITPERALRVNFSQPYGFSGVSLVANKEMTKAFTGFAQLNDKSVKIGVVKGTVAADVAQRIFEKAEIKVFADNNELVKQLLKGQLHAYVESDPLPKYLSLQHPDKLDLPLSQPLLSTREAFAVRKGDSDFIFFLNAWVNAREADGIIGSIRRYWFESLDWQQEAK